MVSLRSAQELIKLIALFLGYLLAITPAGWFRAWVAKQYGDDTGEQLGLLTLNPFAHISFMGLIFLFLPFFRFGWGKEVPIDPTVFEGKHRRLKYAVALFSNTFAHWVTATVALVVIIAILGPNMRLTADGGDMLVAGVNMGEAAELRKAIAIMKRGLGEKEEGMGARGKKGKPAQAMKKQKKTKRYESESNA